MHQIFWVRHVKNKKSLNPTLYLIASFSNLLRDFISKLIDPTTLGPATKVINT